MEEYINFKNKYKDYPFIDNYFIDFALTEKCNRDNDFPELPQIEAEIII